MSENFSLKSTQEIAKNHGTNLDTGLTLSQVETLRDKYGPNKLEEEEGESIWQKI
jgi:magnesium-transporting ATPase (P-type)